MYHRGGRGFHNGNFQRTSRKDQWDYENGRQNNNYYYVRNNRSKSATRYSQPQWRQVPHWMKGRGNHNQRGRRSSSCGGPPRRFFNNQGSPQTFHNNQGSQFHSPRGPKQDSRQQWNYKLPNSANVRHDEHRFDQRRMIDNDNDSNNYANQQMNNSSGCYEGRSPDRQDIQQCSQNNYVPNHQKERESHPLGVNITQKKENRKLWVINQTVLAFIAANVPTDLQQQARSAFEQINDRVITKVTVYHCKYCSIRCRTLQDLESHKTTQMHIKKRDKFVKNWCKTIVDEKK